MKKFLPFILLGLGIVVLLIVFFVVKKSKEPKPEPESEESVLIDVSFKDRPIVSLIPSSDGHYLKFKVEKIVIPAATLDYELLYQTKDDVTQGVPGTVTLSGGSFEADLLLGSESSGKFRYDEGVETGSITLRFRNEKGKLIARFSSDFHMQTNTDTLSASDKNFEYKLDKKSPGFFVTMNSVGLDGVEDVSSGPYAIYASLLPLPSGSFDPAWKKSGEVFFFKN